MSMHKLHIYSTSSTPEVYLSPDEDIFIISGTSSPEDVRTMYYPVIEWINKFISEVIKGKTARYTSEKPLILKIDLIYFNSSSAKFLYDIFHELKKLSTSGIPYVVEWLHDEEDIDMKEAGLDISSLAGMEFTFVPKSRK
jgi:hypothetical protein